MDRWDNKVPKDKVAILKVVSHSILEKKIHKHWKHEGERRKKHHFTFTTSHLPHHHHHIHHIHLIPHLLSEIKQNKQVIKRKLQAEDDSSVY